MQRSFSFSTYDFSKRLLAQGLDYSAILKVPLSVYVATFAINILGLALPLAVLQVYDRVIPNQSYATLTIFAIALTTVFAIDTVLRISRFAITSWSASAFTQIAMIDAAERLVQSAAVDGRMTVSNQQDRLNSVQTVGDYMGGQSRLFFVDLPFTAVFLFIIALVGGVLAFIPVIILTVFGIASYRRGRMLADTFRNRNTMEGRAYDFLIEVMTGIEAVKTHAMESQFSRRYERLQKTVGPMTFDLVEKAEMSTSLGSALNSLAMISIVSAGGYLAANGHMSIGTLACCTLLSNRMMQPIMRGISTWNELQAIRAAYDEFSRVIELPKPNASRLARGGGTPPEISLRNVSLSVGRDSLRMDLTIPPGELIVVKGGGAATTAFANTIRGVTDIELGEARLGDETAIDAALNHTWSVAYVQAQTQMFRGSILDNVTLFREGCTAADALEVCKTIGIEDVVDRLPQGYDTMVGEGIADNLPAGVSKLLSIVTALALDPQILIVDEPQTTLDSNQDRNLLAFFNEIRGSRTIIVVSSRPSYWNLADRLFEVADGELREVAPVQPASGNKTAAAGSGGGA